MNTLKRFFYALLSNEPGISSKRFIALTGFLFLAITMLVSSFTDATKVPATILVDAVTYITLAAITGNVVAGAFAGKPGVPPVDNVNSEVPGHPEVK